MHQKLGKKGVRNVSCDIVSSLDSPLLFELAKEANFEVD